MFNKIHCLKLLKERRDLKKQGKELRNINKVKYDTLITYLILLEDQIFWESRREYFQMVDLCINKKITFNEFLEQFFTLRGLNLRSARLREKKLEEEAFGISPKSTEINIQLNSESSGFGSIISDLHSLVEVYNPDITFQMNLENPELIYYGMGEEYLRLRIAEDFFPQLEKCR